MRLSSASVRTLFPFSSARKQTKIDTTITIARGSRQKDKTPRTEKASAPLQPSQPSLPLPSLPSDITMPIASLTDPIAQDGTDKGSQSSLLAPLEVSELDTREPSTSTGPKNVKISISDSQDARGLENPTFSDGEKPPTQATDDREHSAKSKKRSRRKAKKAKSQGQGSLTPAVDYCGPMTAPATSRRGPPITPPKPNFGSSLVPPPFAFAEATKAEETLREENEKLRRELKEAKYLAKGLKEAHFQLEEEVEAWKLKCEGFSEAVKELKAQVEGMINSRTSKFFDKMEEKKAEEETERERREKERKDKEREKKGGNSKKWKGMEGKEEVENKKGGEDRDAKEGEAKVKEAERKARQEKIRQSSLEQIQAYQQRKKEEESRRKRWWARFHIKLSRTFWRRVVMTLFLLGLITLLLAPFVLIAIGEIQAYSRAHARRVKRLKLKESRNVQFGKAVAQFAADLSPEPIRGILYRSFLDDGWNLDEPY